MNEELFLLLYPCFSERIDAMVEKQIERRKHQRFTARNGTFAVIGPENAYLDEIKKMSMGEIACAVYKSNPKKLGQIIDMSQGGLAFSYIDKRERSGKSQAMDILSAGNQFYLENVLFKTIMDADAADEPAFSPIKLKRQRIQFVNLTSDQKRKLAHFLSNYTDGDMISQ